MSYFSDLYEPDPFEPDEPQEVTCKFCGKSGLRWEETDTGWVLIEGQYKIHNCRAAATSADDFETLA